MDQVQAGREPCVEEPTQKFFRDIEQSATLPEGVDAERAASAVLCTLMMRVTGGEAREFVESMPPPLSRRLRRCIDHRDEQPRKFDRAEFLSFVADHLGVEIDQAERISRAVFAAVREDLPQREVDDVETQLPRDLAELWRRP